MGETEVMFATQDKRKRCSTWFFAYKQAFVISNILNKTKVLFKSLGFIIIIFVVNNMNSK